jgi:anaerobic selenocysteine-containing dehydrogenase
MVEHKARTTCNRDCPDACGIVATIDDGVIVKLEGDPDHPVTKGFLCYRTSRFPELLASGVRVAQPMIRRNDRLEPATWDAALDLIAKKLLQVRDESGPEAIFHYRSGGSLGILKHLTDLFFDEFGPCTTKVGDICSGAGEAAQLTDFGTSDSNDLFDLLNSKHIVLWGKNPKVSNVHLIPILNDAKKNGAEVVSIDPLQHKSTSLADHSVQPRPGGDYELVMGIARTLFDTDCVDPKAREFCDNFDAFRALVHRQEVGGWARLCDVSEADIRQLAARFAEGPTAILVGWGMQRRQRGGAIVRALDALCAISGNLFRSGGGCSFNFARRKPFRPFGGVVEHPRTIREPLFGRDMLDSSKPPLRVMWVTAGNPVSMLPDAKSVAKAVNQTEFVVVADCLMTDTARRADVVLPIPTLLEDDDLMGAYGHHWISESRPVVAAPPGVQHEVRIFQELAKRVGLDSYPQDSIDQLKRMALQVIAGQGAGLESLRRDGVVRSPLANSLLFSDGRVLTANGRVQLFGEPPPEVQVDAPDITDGSSEPLWLFSNSTEKSQGSQWAGRGLGECSWITVHPAALPGIEVGSVVRVMSPTGEIEAEVRHDPAQRRDVAIMPKGGQFDRGHSANTLIAARATDVGLGAAYLDCLVRIAPR